MPEELRAEDDVERIVGIGEPLQDVAFLEDDGAWPLGGNVGLSCQCLRLLQDVYRDIDADRRAFASVLGQARGDGAWPAADIENAVYLLDVQQEEGGIRLGRARQVGCDSVVGVALRVVVLRHVCHVSSGEANVFIALLGAGRYMQPYGWVDGVCKTLSPQNKAPLNFDGKEYLWLPMAVVDLQT
ncbi:hypothetical protein G7Y89_g13405 [Cudoniella acicularis]|uniref:Uncharacterized protein n=1 Tax=Cudoniella acicularis TaxID=354080 RepID=A0A8H4VYQ7_9HELO|nr:hypothetical protein G7Y89_g13405 [Cudoniella acicularis]